MAEFPIMPFITDKYLGDTRHLNAAQHGAYLLLLITSWRTNDCALPNDDKLLAKWAAMTKREWDKNKEVILSFWELGSDAKLRSPTQIKVLNSVRVKQQQRVQAGVASSLKRKETTPTDVDTSLQRERHENPTIKTKIEIKTASQPTVPEPTRARLAADEICREEILPSHWQDYAEAKSIPNEQIFKSWTKFKELSVFPYSLSRWQAWINRERTARAA